MSFVRTLATLAAGYAAAKGYDKYRKMGGMAGVQDAMRDNPAVANAQAQMGAMMEKMGFPGGADALNKMMDQFTGAGTQAEEAAAAGMGGLMSALGGASAAGAEASGQMMDALTGNTATSDAMEENAKLMIRAMIQAAKADGEIDADERARILGLSGRDGCRRAGVRRGGTGAAHRRERAGNGHVRADEGSGLCHVGHGGEGR